MEVVDIEPANLRAIYNIACIYAVTGHNETCLKWLEKLFTLDKSLIDRVQNDSDFAAITKTEEFKDLIAKFR